MSDLSALRERVESATGADREIDGALWKELNREAWAEQCTFKGTLYAGHKHTPAEKRKHELRSAEFFAPRYTASLDAALALVEAKLPGRDIDLEIRETMADGVVLRVTDAAIYPLAYSDDQRSFKAYGNTPALALLAALLAALDGDTPNV